MRTGRCKGFKQIPADAIGHHPYQLLTSPFRHSIHRFDAAINDSRKLLRMIDRLTRLRAFRPGLGRRLNAYYTEFGYQTNPPDPFAGVSLSAQRRYLQQAAYVVYRSPRVKEINQFRLSDGASPERASRRFEEFQSGLLFRNRRKKPAYHVFPNPFVIRGSRFWGQVRPGRRAHRAGGAQAQAPRALPPRGAGAHQRHGLLLLPAAGPPTGLLPLQLGHPAPLFGHPSA